MPPVHTQPATYAPTPDIVDGLMSQVVHEGLTPHEPHTPLPWTAPPPPPPVRTCSRILALMSIHLHVCSRNAPGYISKPPDLLLAQLRKAAQLPEQQHRMKSQFAGGM